MERKRPTLILLRGNSGSGKTTVARKLQQRLGPNTMLISHDMVRLQILHVWGEEGARRSRPLMIELLKYGARHSAVTVMEGILDSDQYAELFDAALELYGEWDIFAYYYDLPFEVTLARHATKPNCADFGEAEMRRWWREKDFLSNIHETILGPELSGEAVTEIICSRLEEEFA